MRSRQLSLACSCIVAALILPWFAHAKQHQHGRQAPQPAAYSYDRQHWVLEHQQVEVVNATVLHTGDGSNFGTYIEGCTVDEDGRAYALNYVINFDGSAIHADHARKALGEITAAGDEATLAWRGAASRMRVRSMVEGRSWNGARFAPQAVMPPRPGDGAETKTVLLADQLGHRVMQAWVEDGRETVIAALCGSDDMVEPNDLTPASNGRVFTSGMRWAQDNVIGDGDLWTCSPSREVGGSNATLLELMGRTNGIDLSPDEKTLYLSEAFNANFTPISNVVWAYDVDVGTGAVANKRLFVDFAALDGSEGSDIDGMRVDVDGNLYVVRNGAWQVDVFSPDGALIRRIYTSFRYPSNLEFGGPDGRTLYIVGRCPDAPWGSGEGCINVYDAPAPGRGWTILQQQR